MLLSKVKEEDLTIENINKIVFDIPSDDGLNGDCILVFGSINYIDERVNKAVELFNQKRAPYILFTGGLGKTGIVEEAKIMKEKAISLGVPEESILTEENSNNTVENVICSLLVLERKFSIQNVKRLIVVTSPFHIRRVILTLNKYMPKGIEYSFSYDENSPVSKSNWTKANSSKGIIMKEVRGLIFKAQQGRIEDIEVL